MSTPAPEINSDSKFTRGEKCIFVHLVITFCGIIAIIIIYYAHVCLVTHRGNIGPDLELAPPSVEKETPDGGVDGPEPVEFGCVGAVYVLADGSERLACAAALLAATWSLVPARCVAARANPSLSHLLPYWTLRYDANFTGVRRGMTHPFYDDDDASCDVGLLEHETAIDASIPSCTVPAKPIDYDVFSSWKDLNVVGWQIQEGKSVRKVRGLSAEKCSQFTAPIVEQQAVCVAADDEFNGSTLLGGVLFAKSQMIAVSSWGNGIDKSFPLVVTDLATFKDWVEMTMTVRFI